MNIRYLVVSALVLGGFVLAASAASADSLAETKKWGEQDRKMADSAADVVKWCGGKTVPHEWDKASFAQAGWEGNSPAEQCGWAYGSLRTICSGLEEAKVPVQQQVKKVVCRYGGKGKFGVTLASGVLTYNMDPAESGVGDKIDSTLKKSLVGSNNETIEDKFRWKAQDGYMVNTIADVNNRCGYGSHPVTLEWDKASFAKEDWSANAPNRACGPVFTDIASICSTFPDKKAAVANKVKKVVCKNGGKGKSSIALVGGTLNYASDASDNNPDEKITAFLKKNL